MRNMIISAFITFICCSICLANTPPLEPRTEPNNTPPPLDKPFFILYAVGNDAALGAATPLPSYWSEIWNPSQVPSVTNYYNSVTNGDVNIIAVPIGSNGVAGGNCLYVNNYRSINPRWFREDEPFYTEAVNSTKATILAAANVYDFKGDVDSKGYVYGAILIPPAEGLENENIGIGLNMEILTGQIANGKQVTFIVNFISRTITKNTFIANCTHEYGHNWFGDMGYWGHYNLGGAMTLCKPAPVIWGFGLRNTGQEYCLHRSTTIGG